MRKIHLLLLSLFLIFSGLSALAQCGNMSFNWGDLDGSSDTIFLTTGDTAHLFATAPASLTDTSFFKWYVGNGTTTIGDTVDLVLNDKGFFEGGVQVESNSCKSSLQPIYFLVSESLNWSGLSWSDSICFHGTAYFQFDSFEPDTLVKKCDSLRLEPVLLEDETTDTPDTTYRDTLIVDCYSSNDGILQPSDLVSICLNIEHSWVGDISMILYAPSGDSVVLYPQSAFSSANLGEPVNYTFSNDAAGVGYTYCFTENQPDFGTLGNQSSVYYTYTDNQGFYRTGFHMPVGSYLPEEFFSQLVGSPINGEWVLQITDHVGSDNGWLFDPTSAGNHTFTITVEDTVLRRSIDTTLTVCVDTFPTPQANEADICIDDTSPWLVNSGIGGESIWYYPDTTTVWATGDSVAPPLLTAVDTHFVFLKGTSLQCGSTWDTAVYIRHADLSLFAPNVTIMAGQSATLGATASGGFGNYAYSWLPSIPLTGENTQHPTTRILYDDLNAFVTATDQLTGCSISRIVQIFVNSPLNVLAGNNDTLCTGSDFTLQATIDNNGLPYDSLRWTTPDTTFNTTPVTFTPTSSGWYTFLAWDDQFTDSDSLYLQVTTPITAGSDYVDTLCTLTTPPLSSVLDPSAASGGSWFDYLGNPIDGNSAAGIGTHLYVVSQAPCPADTAEYTFVYSGISNLPASDSASWCQNSGIQSIQGLSVDTDTASIGWHSYTQVLSNGPCSDTVTRYYEIKLQPQAQWLVYPTDPCLDASPTLLDASPTGGLFSGPGIA